LYGGASSMGRLDRFSAAAWWKQSFGQLRKAIASFI
jgi:hypothetical protein